MSEHPNAAIVRTMIDAMQSGNPQGMAAALAEDVEWHEIGRAEPVRGLRALAERFSGGGTSDYEFGGSTHAIVANDDHTVALLDVNVKRGDRTFNYKVAEVYHIRDGKITARWAMSDDTARINEFFADWPA